jgi:hypothetical protein
VLLAVVACAQPEQQGEVQAADSVLVVFTRDEMPAGVRRPGSNDSPALRTALEWLVRGPTPEEQASGIRSWFSGGTAGALKSVAVDSVGSATVDFEDLRALIPNASSSAGSAMLLKELQGTVFQFPEIRSVEFRILGSCDLFWEWLQQGCQVVPRPGA